MKNVYLTLVFVAITVNFATAKNYLYPTEPVGAIFEAANLGTESSLAMHFASIEIC